MQTIRNTLTRLSSLSFRRMFSIAKLVQKESGKPVWRILSDMVFCYLRYGVGYLDYLTFGFIYQPAGRRKTFMTMNQNLALVRRLNDPALRRLFDDKAVFNRLFRPFLGRDFLDLRESDPAGLLAFLSGKRRIFAKPADAFGGKGIERIEAGEEDAGALYARLCGSRLVDLEEEIVQHGEMNRLAGSSVNSLRMVTVEKDGRVTLMYTILRVGDGRGFVDNISSGGMYCPVSREGTVTAAAFRDKTGLYYDRHPESGTLFLGFSVPFYREAAELALTAAKVVGGIRYVGWDVAITESGPVLIEGNVIPGYDMCQNYRHLGSEKTGILPLFRAVLGEEMDGV